MERFRHLAAVAAAFAVAFAFACDTDGGGTEPDPTTSVTVIVTGDGDPLGGVTVALYEQGSATVLETATTASNGRAQFAELSEGTYEAEITLPDGYAVENGGPTRQTVQATESEPGSVTFALVTDDTGTTPDVVEVHLTSSLTFEPAQVTITPGTTVRWVNDAAIFHTITPNGHNEWARATVSSSGEMFSHTFNVEGEFPYYCEPHRNQGMTGTVTVQSSSVAAGT